MERPVLQPLRRLATSVTLTATRAQSTSQRTRKALKIAPHHSFTAGPGEDHIIFNPPSAAPSVYHTPFKFLPRSDPRRQANLTQLLRSTSQDGSGDSSSSVLAPAAGGTPSFVAPKRHVTREQVEEMRALRAEDPARWSVVRLAQRFDCSNYFVMMCCRSSAEHRQAERDRLDAVKARWGPIRAKAREDRQKRKALLARGEL
jgi:hypothetical protein